MKNKAIGFLEEFKEMIVENDGLAGGLEKTFGNYDDSGKLISDGIPTITTDLCEIGIYKNDLYFVFIVHSRSFNKNFFESISKFSNVKIYGFNDFKTTLYPKEGFSYGNFIEIAAKDKYIQIQFNYELDEMTARDCFVEYKKIELILIKNKIAVINQLTDNY